MDYKSPFHLFGKEIERYHIKKERTRLLAQFESNDDQPIELEGKLYTKPEVIELLDTAEDRKKYDYHLKIYKNKILLNFLEEGYFSMDDAEAWNDESLFTEEFINFVSPYFVYRYSSLYYQAYKALNYAFLEQLKFMPLLCKEEQYDECYKKTYNEFNSLCESLEKDVNTIQQTNDLGQIRGNYYETPERINCINAFTDYFDELVDKNAFNLGELSSQALKYANPEFGRKILNQAIRINCRSEVKDKMMKLYNTVKNNNRTSSNRNTEEETNPWRVIRVILGLLLLAIAIARRCA